LPLPAFTAPRALLGRRAQVTLAWLAFAVLLCVSTALFAQALQPIPPLEARVTDLTGTLTPGERSALEQKLAAFEQRKGAQVAVLIVPTTKPEEIEQYSIRVVDEWKLGRGEVNGQRVDDGALLLVAKNDRRVRIEVGYGLEGALTDATSRRIIAETITPLFRQGQFYAGINAGLDQMIRVIDGEPLPPPDRQWRGGAQQIGSSLPVLIFFVLIASIILRGIFGRGLGAVATGGATGALAYVFSHVMPIALFAGGLAFLFTLLTGFGGRGWYSGGGRHRGYGGWGYGGGFGGLGGGGFGRGGGFGGGFGGGGGGFGGGGASGSW